MLRHSCSGELSLADVSLYMDCPDFALVLYRMLEAAMLGIPYEGRIPDFAAQPSRPYVPPSSESLAGRSVRQEQDWAYEQSLQVHYAHTKPTLHLSLTAEQHVHCSEGSLRHTL